MHRGCSCCIWPGGLRIRESLCCDEIPALLSYGHGQVGIPASLSSLGTGWDSAARSHYFPWQVRSHSQTSTGVTSRRGIELEPVGDGGGREEGRSQWERASLLDTGTNFWHGVCTRMDIHMLGFGIPTASSKSYGFSRRVALAEGDLQELR